MTGKPAELDEKAEGRVFFVCGRAWSFAITELLLVVQSWAMSRDRMWLEAFVTSHVRGTRESVWWISGIDGWDLLLLAPPEQELLDAALAVTRWHWARGEVNCSVEKGSP